MLKPEVETTRYPSFNYECISAQVFLKLDTNSFAVKVFVSLNLPPSHYRPPPPQTIANLPPTPNTATLDIYVKLFLFFHRIFLFYKLYKESVFLICECTTLMFRMHSNEDSYFKILTSFTVTTNNTTSTVGYMWAFSDYDEHLNL